MGGRWEGLARNSGGHCCCPAGLRLEVRGRPWGQAEAGTPAVAHLSSDFMNVYYQIRSSQLDRSIKGLKEHFRKSSSSSGVPYSPAVPNKRKDTPTKKPVKRPGETPPWPTSEPDRSSVGPGLPLPTLGVAAATA